MTSSMGILLIGAVVVNRSSLSTTLAFSLCLLLVNGD
jgi:hypothetical protein